jgi:hypothetical protein
VVRAIHQPATARGVLVGCYLAQPVQNFTIFCRIANFSALQRKPKSLQELVQLLGQGRGVVEGLLSDEMRRLKAFEDKDIRLKK